MGIDSTSVAGNTCKDNWTKCKKNFALGSKRNSVNLRTVQGVKRRDSSQDVAVNIYFHLSLKKVIIKAIMT
uniref:Uncharacterized protein n=1 Tax=Rhodnius prolixus TaxID=13249 RepID=T1HSM6_RHOPR